MTACVYNNDLWPFGLEFYQFVFVPSPPKLFIWRIFPNGFIKERVHKLSGGTSDGRTDGQPKNIIIIIVIIVITSLPKVIWQEGRVAAM